MDRKIVDMKVSTLRGKIIKTVYYSDGTKQTGIVSETQVKKMLETVEKTPDLRIIKGKKNESGRISFMVLGILSVVVAVLTGCVEQDDRCVRPGWHKYNDCYGEP